MLLCSGWDFYFTRNEQFKCKCVSDEGDVGISDGDDLIFMFRDFLVRLQGTG